MLALLCLATNQDPYRLLTLLREEPDLFDSLWMMAIPVEQEQTQETAEEDTSSDIDAILQGEKR